MRNCTSNIKKITFFWLFIACSLLRTNAQVGKKIEKEKYTIYIEENDVRIKANVLAHKTKIKTKKELTYYWYSTNKIMETQGGYDGKLLHGEYVNFYQSNNNLKEKGKFKKGLKHKEWTLWFDNGKINTISRWKYGQLHGSYKIYTVAGDLTSEKRYKKGKEVKLRKNISQRIKGLFKGGNKEKKKPILAS